LKAVIGFQEEDPVVTSSTDTEESIEKTAEDKPEAVASKDLSKIKVEDLNIPTRVATLLSEASIRSVAGLARKSVSSIKEIEGIGDKAIGEISSALADMGVELKGE